MWWELSCGATNKQKKLNNEKKENKYKLSANKHQEKQI